VVCGRCKGTLQLVIHRNVSLHAACSINMSFGMTRTGSLFLQMREHLHSNLMRCHAATATTTGSTGHGLQVKPHLFAAAAPGPLVDKPKKPKNGWMHFLQDFRQTHPSLGKETLLSASKSWKALSDAQKAPFEVKYHQEKKQYTELMASITSSGQEMPKTKKARTRRDPEKPKKPANAFLRFAMEYRQKNPNLKVTENAKAAKHIWDGFSAGQKKVYEASYEEEKKVYNVEMEKYKSSGKDKAWKSQLRASATKQKAQPEVRKKRVTKPKGDLSRARQS